jgi:hypothetical protein
MKPREMLHRKLAQQTRQSQIDIRITRLREYPAIRGAAELTLRIAFRGADALELEDVEFVEEVEARQAEANHTFPEVEFGGCGVPGSVDDNFGLVAGVIENGEFGCGRGRGAADAADSDAVGSQYILREKLPVRGSRTNFFLLLELRHDPR